MKIVLLCGESGVGKSSVATELCKNKDFNLIKSYTDRPMRGTEYDHIFLDKKHMDELMEEDLVAFTEIHGNRYCTCHNQFVEDKINVYVVDAYGINDTIKAFPEAEVMSVLITRKKVYIDEDRKNRDIKIPSRDDVSVMVDNDTSIEACANTIKALTKIHNGIFFKTYHHQIMTIQDKIDYHLDAAQYHNEQARSYQEELKCMHSTE